MIVWNPIATAPKDGSFILLRGGRIDEYSTDEKSKVPPCVVAYWFTHRWGTEGRWIITDYDGGAAAVDYEEPTEWLALDAVLAGDA